MARAPSWQFDRLCQQFRIAFADGYHPRCGCACLEQTLFDVDDETIAECRNCGATWIVGEQ